MSPTHDMTSVVSPTNLSSPKRSTKAFAALLKRFRNDDEQDNYDEDNDSDLDFGCSGLSYIDTGHNDDENDTQGFAAAARFMESELHISLEKAHLERNKRKLKQERYERGNANNTAAASVLLDATQQPPHTPLQLQSRSMSISDSMISSVSSLTLASSSEGTCTTVSSTFPSEPASARSSFSIGAYATTTGAGAGAGSPCSPSAAAAVGGGGGGPSPTLPLSNRYSSTNNNGYVLGSPHSFLSQTMKSKTTYVAPNNPTTTFMDQLQAAQSSRSGHSSEWKREEEAAIEALDAFFKSQSQSQMSTKATMTVDATAAANTSNIIASRERGALTTASLTQPYPRKYTRRASSPTLRHASPRLSVARPSTATATSFNGSRKPLFQPQPVISSSASTTPILTLTSGYTFPAASPTGPNTSGSTTTHFSSSLIQDLQDANKAAQAYQPQSNQNEHNNNTAFSRLRSRAFSLRHRRSEATLRDRSTASINPDNNTIINRGTKVDKVPAKLKLSRHRGNTHCSSLSTCPPSPSALYSAGAASAADIKHSSSYLDLNSPSGDSATLPYTSSPSSATATRARNDNPSNDEQTAFVPLSSTSPSSPSSSYSPTLPLPQRKNSFLEYDSTPSSPNFPRSPRSSSLPTSERTYVSGQHQEQQQPHAVGAAVPLSPTPTMGIDRNVLSMGNNPATQRNKHKLSLAPSLMPNDMDISPTTVTSPRPSPPHFIHKSVSLASLSSSSNVMSPQASTNTTHSKCLFAFAAATMPNLNSEGLPLPSTVNRPTTHSPLGRATASRRGSLISSPPPLPANVNNANQLQSPVGGNYSNGNGGMRGRSGSMLVGVSSIPREKPIYEYI